uniref:DSBA-like thioredoxin domain-containing protein n=1 Tax=Odontella aurita TaxID=265563 RepID=A0A7S4N3L0_9STRA|mmetsp:Transcript_46096/g.139843  ORF Transcript_46096/g.139843 Transcript_46096/m.139843 type:complete len:172 (+) Transcript_46096:260-775(+)|eukprot:CAMPEP_0113580194 /NCGR_PEP_ID=MMETSP0015_2-20120614/30530_1 /TAXON_ID=2838 /ORGANISM="Odontella" /LENGTH=171 /DNA_ID=CAMNT_0000484341 /DNA_START=236 /DNA_END=751 /DNA_ORIENTATION=+ /assembly_acc=CAM_ASM_000160
MIDPQTNRNGEEFEAYNTRRWGSSGWTHHLKSEGRKDGATFKKWVWWPNTSKAHELVLFAERNGIDTSISNRALFEAIYEEGENISLVNVLVKVGERLNLPSEELRRFLENEEGKRDVVKEIQTGRKKYRISGVPYFIIGREGSNELPYGLSGAQEARTFLQYFEELSDDA